MNAEGLAEKVEELIRKPKLKECYIEYHREHIVDNNSEKEKLSVFLSENEGTGLFA